VEWPESVTTVVVQIWLSRMDGISRHALPTCRSCGLRVAQIPTHSRQPARSEFVSVVSHSTIEMTIKILDPIQKGLYPVSPFSVFNSESKRPVNKTPHKAYFGPCSTSLIPLGTVTTQRRIPEPIIEKCAEYNLIRWFASAAAAKTATDIANQIRFVDGLSR
jgi:hypothetical protein